MSAKFAFVGIATSASALLAFRLLQRERRVSRSTTEKSAISSDPLLALYGSGKRLWADEHADSYVARLREGWR